MKLTTTCYYCLSDFHNQLEVKSRAGETLSPESYKIPSYCFVHFLVKDENVYQLTCERGHHFYQFFEQAKFEVLFNSGLNAFIDGYLRESVTSVAASLERFYEFAMKVMCHAKQVHLDRFDETWSLVKAQSERQLGGFIYCYLITTNSKPPTLSGTKVEFRNDVIHKGRFPTEEKTLNYFRDVLALIYDILDALIKHTDNALGLVYGGQIQEIRDKHYTATGLIQTFSGNSLVNNYLNNNFTRQTVEELIANIKAARKASE